MVALPSKYKNACIILFLVSSANPRRAAGGVLRLQSQLVFVFGLRWKSTQLLREREYHSFKVTPNKLGASVDLPRLNRCNLRISLILSFLDVRH